MHYEPSIPRPHWYFQSDVLRRLQHQAGVGRRWAHLFTGGWTSQLPPDYFARGFYASALHEIAHWCVAGPQRRLLEDFGYWYEPDGRTAQVQAEFEKVEIRPQAYEWILAISAGFPFTVSCDNLNGDFEPDRLAFMSKVHSEVLKILEQGLPQRVKMLSEALRAFYQTPALLPEHFAVK